MFPILLARFRCLAAALVISTYSTCLCAQASQAQPSLKTFFQVLVQRYDAKALPRFDDAWKVIEQARTMRPEDIANAIPAILAAWGHPDDNVKGYAFTAIFAISERPDGANLLKPYTRAIAGGLDVPSGRLQGATVMLLARLRPEPDSEAVSLLVAFVKRTDRHPLAQADAFSILLRIAPDNPDLTPALQDFLARPMDERTKEAVINDMANAHTENIVATDYLIRALEDSKEEVRFQAAQAFQRMPRDAVRRAQGPLQRTKERPDEAQEVRDAAKEALRQLEAAN